MTDTSYSFKHIDTFIFPIVLTFFCFNDIIIAPEFTYIPKSTNHEKLTLHDCGGQEIGQCI